MNRPRGEGRTRRALVVSGLVVASGLGIAAFTTGIVLGVFFLGMFTQVGPRGALTGLLAGLAASSLMKLDER